MDGSRPNAQNMEAAAKIYGFVVFRFDVRARCSQLGKEEDRRYMYMYIWYPPLLFLCLSKKAAYPRQVGKSYPIIMSRFILDTNNASSLNVFRFFALLYNESIIHSKFRFLSLYYIKNYILVP